MNNADAFNRIGASLLPGHEKSDSQTDHLSGSIDCILLGVRVGLVGLLGLSTFAKPA